MWWALLLVMCHVSRGAGQECTKIRPILLCNDLCHDALEHPRVQEVRFSGVLASFQCVPATVKVSENKK
jgi:hypothetical protein